jgi:hypothetical protein
VPVKRTPGKADASGNARTVDPARMDHHRVVVYKNVMPGCDSGMM